MPSTDPFDGTFSTGQSERFTPADHQEKLLCIIGTSTVEQERDTDYGPSKCIEAIVAVIDEKTPGESYVFDDVLLFPAVLRNIAKGSAKKGGKPHLGVLAKGDKKPGKSEPWIMDDPNPAQIKAAGTWYTAWKAARDEETFSTGE